MAEDSHAELLALAAARRKAREQLAARAALSAARLWRRLAIASLTQSWDGGTGRDLFLLASGAQLAAAGGAGQYADQALAFQGISGGGASGEPVPGAFAGIASDGRPLQSLLYQPVISTKERIGLGMDAHTSFGIGQRELQRIVVTQVTDAGRTSDGVGIMSRYKAKGYVRVLTPPSCARCAILAGAYYSAEKAFPRHPRCDCIHLPIGDKGIVPGVITNVGDYFKSLSEGEQRRFFTTAGAQAIRDGANINQVVNARLGMSTAGGVKTTTSGITIHGKNRLMPEAIYALASDRDEALRLLKRYGYLS